MKTLIKSIALAAVMMSAAGLAPQFTHTKSAVQVADCNDQTRSTLDCSSYSSPNFPSPSAGKGSPVWKSSADQNIPQLVSIFSGPSQQPMQVGGVNCAQGSSIVVASGFNSVKPTNCDGRTYTYQALRLKQSFEVSVSARSGTILGTTID